MFYHLPHINNSCMSRIKIAKKKFDAYDDGIENNIFLNSFDDKQLQKEKKIKVYDNYDKNKLHLNT